MAFFTKFFGRSPVEIAGLDVGSVTTKVIELVKVSDSIKALRIAICPTPPLAIKDEVISEPQLVAEELKQLLTAHEFEAKKVVTLVTGRSVVIRTIEMTIMTERELKNSVKFEAERYLPYSVAEAQIDGVIIRKPLPGDDKKMEVLLLAALRDRITDAEEVTKRAGLQVSSIELEPLALLRLLQFTLSPEELKQTIALINIGASTSNINIFKDGMLRHSRVVTVAGNSFTRAIGQGMSLSFDDAEKLKKEKATVRIEKEGSPVAPTTMRIFNVIAPILTELVTEIQRTFDFYRSRYRGETVDVIYLTGGTSKLKNIAQYLSDEIGVRTGLFDPIKKIQVENTAGISKNDLPELVPHLSVAFGLALRPWV